jgi:predicted RNA-binding Zn-ribbon protein involved in translation (DUF1610 family)
MEHDEKIKCPNCKEDINYLVNVQSGTKLWEMKANRDGAVYKNGEFHFDDGTNDFECPECQFVITNDESKAVKLLRMKKKKKKIRKIKNGK